MLNVKAMKVSIVGPLAIVISTSGTNVRPATNVANVTPLITATSAISFQFVSTHLHKESILRTD